MKELFGYNITRCGKVFNRFGKQLKDFESPSGYRIISLRVAGKSRTFGVHRLVALAYIPNPEGLSDVDHINGDRADNRVENLRWLSHSDNIRHSYNSGRRNVSGVKNANAKLTEDQVVEICERLQAGERNKSRLSRELGVSRASVNNIFHRKQWAHISEKYQW